MSRTPQGLRAWLVQRLSAVYLGGFLFYGGARWLLMPPQDWVQWHVWLSHPLMRIASAVFILAILVHVWIGMRNVVLDYVRPFGVRLSLLALIGLVLAGCGLWSLQVLVTA